MSENIDRITKIAQETRRDFLAGAIAVPHLVEIALINRPGLSDEEVARLEHSAASALANFPDEACQVATDELLHRIGHGTIIDGGYRVTGQGELDGFWRHEFLDIGETELASNTIVDVTADQFGGPKVYVGAYQNPWSSLEEMQKAKQQI